MQAGDPEGGVTHIDPDNAGAFGRKGLAQDAAAASHVQNPGARKDGAAEDIAQTQRVDVMKGLELPFPIPPETGSLFKFFQLPVIDIHGLFQKCQSFLFGVPAAGVFDVRSVLTCRRLSFI